VSATASFPALGTTAHVAVSRPPDLEAARDLLARELAAVDRACSRFRRDSELARANARAGERIEIGPVLTEAIGAALAAAVETEGLVDPTLGADLRAVGYDRTFALVQARNGWTIESRARSHGAWQQIELDSARGELKVPAGVELDLGATAKALAADRAAEHIVAALGGGVLVSLGGDVAVAGEPPRNGWCIRIADDHAAPLDGPGVSIFLSSGGLATSGTTVRRWRTDRGEAHHVLDPRTGLPALTPWRTLSVAAHSCLDANVAATAALVIGDEAPDWLRRRNLPARLVATGGRVVNVAGWPEDAEVA